MVPDGPSQNTALVHEQAGQGFGARWRSHRGRREHVGHGGRPFADLLWRVLVLPQEHLLLQETAGTVAGPSSEGPVSPGLASGPSACGSSRSQMAIVSMRDRVHRYVCRSVLEHHGRGFHPLHRCSARQAGSLADPHSQPGGRCWTLRSPGAQHSPVPSWTVDRWP